MSSETSGKVLSGSSQQREIHKILELQMTLGSDVVRAWILLPLWLGLLIEPGEALRTMFFFFEK